MTASSRHYASAKETIATCSVLHAGMSGHIHLEACGYVSNSLLSSILGYLRAFAVGRDMTGHVLDYGCGEGALIPYCASRDYTGVDIDEDCLSIAARTYPALRFQTAADFRATNEQFDSISLCAVIAHVDDKLGLLTLFKQHLRDDGKILITTPHPYANWIHRLGAKTGVFANDGYAWKEQVSAAQMEQLAVQTGLVVKERRLFMLGMNQLFILVRDEHPENAARSHSPTRV